MSSRPRDRRTNPRPIRPKPLMPTLMVMGASWPSGHAARVCPFRGYMTRLAFRRAGRHRHWARSPGTIGPWPRARTRDDGCMEAHVKGGQMTGLAAVARSYALLADGGTIEIRPADPSDSARVLTF